MPYDNNCAAQQLLIAAICATSDVAVRMQAHIVNLALQKKSVRLFEGQLANVGRYGQHLVS